MRKTTQVIRNFLISIISIAVTLILAEVVFRKVIFGNNKAFDKLRIANNYADQEWDDNYWKLAQIWKTILEPGKPNFLLGWQFEFFPKSLMHREAEKIRGKRPVLFYGDSFANCIDSTDCFEDFLNGDSAFRSKYYFLNYGVGGYGVDQCYTLMKNTYIHYKDPIVIFSFLTNDLDRSILAYRGAQKPTYFIDANNSLRFDTSKFDPDQHNYLKNNPPDIKSYLWRKFLYSDLNFLPVSWTQFFTGETAARKSIASLNSVLLKETIKILNESNTDYLILVFPRSDDIKFNNSWRLKFCKDFFAENKAPVIWTDSLIKSASDSVGGNIDYFYIAGDGHPNSFQNKIVAKEIKDEIFERFNVSHSDSSQMIAKRHY